MQLPSARGPLSTALVAVLDGDRIDGDRIDGHRIDLDGLTELARRLPGSTDVLTDDDVQLTLWILYELGYRGFDGVDESWEWDPDLLRTRGELERRFEAALRRLTDEPVTAAVEGPGDVPTRLFRLTETFDEGPSVARYVHRRATLAQFTEFLVHRSVYHLKESDPHSWVLPRLDGRAKVALAELQYDEYGGGRPERLHATMFGDSLEACGLDREYGAYLDRVPGYTLAVNNAMSLFGLHRRLRGAAMGHLGAFEATSSLPCRRYAAGVRRFGLPEKVAEYFDEHVEADAVHEQLAFRDICGALAEDDEQLVGDVFFGAATCLALDAVAGERMVNAWEAGRTTLRDEEPGVVAVAS